ncbi:MAG TPA: hypothetical protein VLA64_00975 [Azonexus sp.]|nr:hypothetical protein [Azonexus sp.]
MSYNEEIERLVSDPGVSFWLRDALLSALQRDPVDAANDAEMLFAVLDKRAIEVRERFLGLSRL